MYVFSTISLQKILEKFNLEIFDIENISTHGGSNRYFIKKKENKTHKISKKVKYEINKELRYGLNNFKTYKKFAEKVSNSKMKLLRIFQKLKEKKKEDN